MGTWAQSAAHTTHAHTRFGGRAHAQTRTRTRAHARAHASTGVRTHTRARRHSVTCRTPTWSTRELMPAHKTHVGARQRTGQQRTRTGLGGGGGRAPQVRGQAGGDRSADKQADVTEKGPGERLRDRDACLRVTEEHDQLHLASEPGARRGGGQAAAPGGSKATVTAELADCGRGVGTHARAWWRCG